MTSRLPLSDAPAATIRGTLARDPVVERLSVGLAALPNGLWRLTMPDPVSRGHVRVNR